MGRLDFSEPVNDILGGSRKEEVNALWPIANDMFKLDTPERRMMSVGVKPEIDGGTKRGPSQ